MAFPLLAGLRDLRRRGRARVWALNPDQFPDDLVNCFEPDETVLGDDAVRRAIGLFQHGIGLRVFCYLVSHCRHSLAGIAAEPEIRPERQCIRIKEYPDDTAGGPLKQSNACGHVRAPHPSVTRFELNMTGQAPEFQRQVISPLSTSGRNTSRSRTSLCQSPRNSSPRNTCSMRFSRALDSA